MPTTRKRHMITESDRISEAISRADKLWPDLGSDRAALLRRILEAGIEVVDAQAMENRAGRLAAISEAAGSLSGAWPKNWREELRDEWPA